MGFVLEHDLGHVTGEQGGYDVSDDDTFAPDVAFISHARQANMPNDKFNPTPPDLAVEVVSPSDLADPKRRIQRKLEKYKAALIPLLWYVYAETQTVNVYVKGEFVGTVGVDSDLDGGEVLPGFKLPVAKIFPKKR
jgi:Uma2 family endonuclease